jgi:hypothetical protein
VLVINLIIKHIFLTFTKGKTIMKTMFIVLFVFSLTLLSQDKKVQASLAASVSQTIGAETSVSITYSRPGVKERTVWGELVPYGMAEGNKYSKGNPIPWRAGANQNSVIEFSHDVMINGKMLKKGKYGIHMLPGKDEWKIMFNNRSEDWGSYSYDSKEDALVITVKPVTAEHNEWLSYGFENLDGHKATAYLHWDKLKVPFMIETKN